MFIWKIMALHNHSECVDHEESGIKTEHNEINFDLNERTIQPSKLHRILEAIQISNQISKIGKKVPVTGFAG